MKFTQYEIESCVRAQFTLGIINDWTYLETLEHIKNDIDLFIRSAKEDEKKETNQD